MPLAPSRTTISNRRARTRAIAVFAAFLLILAVAASPASAKGKKDDSKSGRNGRQSSQTSVASEPASATTPSTTTSTEATADSTTAQSLGSMSSVVDQVGARSLWKDGFTGKGVHIAVIDTGVAPVPALSGADKVVAMVDLSLEAGVAEATYLDNYGHGSHMAGIIAGRSPGADPTNPGPNDFLGVAPDAGIVSVKVGDNTGAVDVSQVIAGIDWVIEHKNTDGLNIRVLNLSYGTDSRQDYRIDPLSFAVERAWDAGIVVVVAAGNEGWSGRNGLANPAHDPYVIAVGGAEATATGFKIPSWTSTAQLATKTADGATTATLWDDYAIFGTSEYSGRLPDLVAPGAHIESLRVPGSRVALEHPEGRVSDEIFKGSGSSQAAAVVTGAAALLIDARPSLTPDEVKALLVAGASPINWALPTTQGAGVVDVAASAALKVPKDATQTWERSTGLGSIEAARGTQHVIVNGEEVRGEVTVTGASWTGASWTGLRGRGLRGRGLRGRGRRGLGLRGLGLRGRGLVDGASWTGASWTGASWTGAFVDGGVVDGGVVDGGVVDGGVVDWSIMDGRALELVLPAGATLS